MSNIFKNVVSRKPHYNNFNLTREVLVSGQIGKLIPVQCEEVVPGDLMQQDVSFLTRFAPLSAPVMARFNVHFHSFYVPYRIITPRNSVESTWEKFVSDLGKPLESTVSLPHIKKGSFATSRIGVDENVPLMRDLAIGSLWDYLGLPTETETNIRNSTNFKVPAKISLLPFLAYQKIYNDFYRRDQIEPEIIFPLSLNGVRMDDFGASGYEQPESLDGRVFDIEDFCRENLFKLRTRNYERDYFTSALPEPQYGEDVSIGDEVLANSNAAISLYSSSPLSGYVFGSKTATESGIASSSWPYYTEAFWNYTSADAKPILMQEGSPTSNSSFASQFAPFANDEYGGMTFDVKNIEGLEHGFSINELRLAMQVQGVREKINRGGTRYIEILHSIYGVRSSDARLQRVQYLGGVTNPVTIGTVIQQSETATTPQGTMTGKATAAGGNRLFRTKRIFEEHGLVMTIMSVTPRASYYGGIPRKFTKFDPIDYYVPDYDRLGEQEINKNELYSGVTDSYNYVDETFGYTPRYSEYKSSISTVTGEFRHSLDNWHVSRTFDDLPSLSEEFIKAEPEDFSRIFEFENVANTSNEHFYAEILISLKAKRPMSKYSTPYTFY